MPRKNLPLSLPALASHRGNLAFLLDTLAGRDGLSTEARAGFLLDPALTLAVLRIATPVGALSSQFSFEELCARVSPATLKGLASNAAIGLLTRPDSALTDVGWIRAISLAHLCRALARLSNHTSLDEAWLAGLLCGFPSTGLSELPMRGFLPDVPRFLHEPAERLLDATLLPRVAAAAWRLLESRDPTDADTLSLLPPLEVETLKAILQEMDNSVAITTTRPQPDLAGALERFTRAELTTSAMSEAKFDGVLQAAHLLNEQDGLFDPLYLRLDKRSSKLESQALGGWPTQPLSIRIEGSNTAAVRAWSTRIPVVAYIDSSDTSLLDLQLARQAGADGVAAIPVGVGATRGVLLVCGDREALADVAAHPERYARLGELAGKAHEAIEAVPKNSSAHPGNRIRRAAHEINNPLGIIKNYLAILKDKLGDEAPISNELDIIHEELDRIVRIVRGLTEDEDDLPVPPEETDVGQLVADLVKVTSPTWEPRDIRISHRTDPALPRLNCDRDKIKQILQNLLLNALEATPNGGEVRLETAQVTNHKQERFIELQVTDSGRGIPRERAAQLFDPVASEKGRSHSGLGLSIVKGLSESLGGTVSFKTGATGTTFQILFRLG